jgi:PKD repeat protein
VRWRLLLVACAACGGNGSRPDASVGPDAFLPHDAALGPDGAPLAWVDFAATGCTLVETPAPVDGGVATATCTGAAPLAVTFSSLASGPIDTWAWTFGDGATSPLSTPAHVYLAPGSYDVQLAAAGPGGSASLLRPGYIVVQPAVLGAPCSADAQCASGSCACGDAACDAAASLCAAPCDAGCSGASDMCGVLGGAWDATMCLHACASDSDCATGRSCMPVAASAGGWAMACVPSGALAPIGASCTGATGLDAGACASGDCLGIGARGACALACAGAGACPDGTACATFGNGTAACLASCDSSHPCGSDPWLACEQPGASGAWGFTLPAAGSVCAPKSCSGAGDCPGGACTGGHCTSL